MGPLRLSAAFLTAASIFAISGGYSFAQGCGPGSGNNIDAAQVTNLLNNRYACVGTSPNADWNELHSGGFVLDYKKGPADKVDPSDTLAHPTGTYAITALPGTVTYTYPGGHVYGYTIHANGTGTIPWSKPGTYSFCTTTGGLNLLVTVQATHC